MNRDQLKGAIAGLMIVCAVGILLGQDENRQPREEPLASRHFARQALLPLLRQYRETVVLIQRRMSSVDGRLSTLVTVQESQTEAIEEQTEQLKRIGKALEALDGLVRVRVEGFSTEEEQTSTRRER